VDAAVASSPPTIGPTQKPAWWSWPGVIRPDGRLVLAEFRPVGPILTPIRRLAGSQHVGALGLDAWRSTLKAAGFHDVTIYPAGWTRRLALFIVGRR
jgi:hypothetical protein